MIVSTLFSALRQDVVHAVRVLRRSPAFAVVAIATLGIGIGASTAVFTVVDAVLLRPLGFAEAERLVMIRPTSGARVSAAYLDEWRRQSRTLQDIVGWHDARAVVTGRGEPLEILTDRVTSNFFGVLGMPPLLGRTLTTRADLADVAPEVVLSHGFWQRRYGGDPSVIAQRITIDGAPLTIVGVMPERFAIRTNELAESRAEAWTALPLVPGSRTGMGGTLNVVARLAPGVTVAQAQAELAVISGALERESPSYSRDWRAEVLPLHDATVREVRLTLLVLFGAVGMLLLIACANVANLVMSRAVVRQAEMAIRLSLGATSQRLVRQVLTESVVLAAAGGVLGAGVALWGTSVLMSALPAGLDLPRTREVAVDLRILTFAVLATLLTAVLFGLIPSLRLARSGSAAALREATRGASTGRTRTRVGSALIVAEVALVVILLAGAGLLARSFWQLRAVEPGFQPEQVLSLRVTLPQAKYDTDERVRHFSRELLERTSRVPGVRAAGFAGYLPLSRIGAGGPFEIAGRPDVRPDERPSSWISIVGGDFFGAMGIPLLRGRLPGPADTEKTQPVFVVDELVARRYWPEADPIGAKITWQRRARGPLVGEVIGVVGSVRWGSLAAQPQATTYWWSPQTPNRDLAIVVRTIGEPTSLATVLSAQVRAIDPKQPVAEIRPLEDFVADDLARRRFTLVVLGGFAAAALVLAAVGLYGVIAFGVAQRTREIGVRVALGAAHRDILRLVIQRGMLLVGAGLVVGIAGALALGRVVASLLYDVTPGDPATFAGVALFLAVVALLATWLPARRVLRVDPTVALRVD